MFTVGLLFSGAIGTTNLEGRPVTDTMADISSQL